jgi:acetyl esterase/lipase
MPSLRSRLVPGYLHLTRTNRIYTSADAARLHIEQRRLRPRPFGPPRRLRADVAVAVEQHGGWPVYTLTPQAGPARGSVVYLHGGGWVNQIARQHWQLTAQIAAEAGTTVVIPIYPLVPFGTAGQVVPAVAELVRACTTRYGSTALAGDSAGGQIALSAAILLRDEQHPVAHTVLIAPALDLSLSNPEIDRVLPSDPWLGRDGTRVFIEHWRGDLALDHPSVSPLTADLTGLGPLTILCGTRDMLNPDTRLLVERARTAGVDVDYHEQVGLVHVYPLTPTREGAAARALIVERLRAARPG